MKQWLGIAAALLPRPERHHGSRQSF
jgi:hypothetical protein